MWAACTSVVSSLSYARLQPSISNYHVETMLLCLTPRSAKLLRYQQEHRHLPKGINTTVLNKRLGRKGKICFEKDAAVGSLSCTFSF